MSGLQWDFAYLVSYFVTYDASRWRFGYCQTILRSPFTFADVDRVRAEVAIELDLTIEHVTIIAVSRLGV